MTDQKLTKAEAGRLGARRRWGPEPRIVRLDQLDPDTRRSILALLARAAGEPTTDGLLRLNLSHRGQHEHEWIENSDWNGGPSDTTVIQCVNCNASEPVADLFVALPSVATRHKVEIRATHPYGFRSGEWARVVGVEWVKDRPCYVVRFPDGLVDSWVTDDSADPYEFRLAVAP